MTNVITDFDQSEPLDIVEELLRADALTREFPFLNSATTPNFSISYEADKGLYRRAAEEIQKLRRVLNITNN